MISFTRWLPLLSCLLLSVPLPGSVAAAVSETAGLPSGVFEEPGSSARLAAMGGAGVSLADDGSGLYINPAGLVAVRNSSLYADYFFESEGAHGGGSVSIVLVRAKASLAAGYFRKERGEGGAESLFSVSAAWMIFEGAEGSFLSAGGAFRGGILSYGPQDQCPVCPIARDTDSALSGDIGMMLRPLPVVSFAYYIGNIHEPEFGVGGGRFEWKRIARWGITWFWEERLTVSWERDHSGGRSTDHYGFSVRTSSSFEIMAGFSAEKVTGGFGVYIDRFHVAAAFVPLGDGGIETWFSISTDFGARDKENPR